MKNHEQIIKNNEKTIKKTLVALQELAEIPAVPSMEGPGRSRTPPIGGSSGDQRRAQKRGPEKGNPKKGDHIH